MLLKCFFGGPRGWVPNEFSLKINRKSEAKIKLRERQSCIILKNVSNLFIFWASTTESGRKLAMKANTLLHYLKGHITRFIVKYHGKRLGKQDEKKINK